jgi:hypothetical protein
MPGFRLPGLGTEETGLVDLRTADLRRAIGQPAAQRLVLQRFCGLWWQAQFSGCAVLWADECSEEAWCDHLNSVTAGLANRVEEKRPDSLKSESLPCPLPLLGVA